MKCGLCGVPAVQAACGAAPLQLVPAHSARPPALAPPPRRCCAACTPHCAAAHTRHAAHPRHTAHPRHAVHRRRTRRPGCPVRGALRMGGVANANQATALRRLRFWQPLHPLPQTPSPPSPSPLFTTPRTACTHIHLPHPRHAAHPRHTAHPRHAVHRRRTRRPGCPVRAQLGPVRHTGGRAGRGRASPRHRQVSVRGRA
jgi:hypothetical protein